MASLPADLPVRLWHVHYQHPTTFGPPAEIYVKDDLYTTNLFFRGQLDWDPTSGDLPINTGWIYLPSRQDRKDFMVNTWLEHEYVGISEVSDRFTFKADAESVMYSPLPEPSSTAMLLIGVLLIIVLKLKPWKRKKK